MCRPRQTSRRGSGSSPGAKPFQRTVPLSGRIRPLIRFSSVLFPEPDAPASATHSPDATVQEGMSRMVRRRVPSGKVSRMS